MLLLRLLTIILVGCLLPPARTIAQVSAPRQPETEGARDSLLHLAQELRSARDYGPSATAARRVISGPNGRYPVDSLTALALINLGNIRYDSVDDAGAAFYYEQALRIRDSLPNSSPQDLAHIRLNLGTSNKYLGNYDQAGTLIRESIELLESDPQVDTVLLIMALNELGGLAMALQDFTIGRSSSHQATSLASEKQDLDLPLSYLTHYRASLILLRLNEIPQAQKYATRALEIAQELGEFQSIADAHNMVGLTHAELGDDEARLESFLSGVTAGRKGTRTDQQLGHLYLNLAEYYGERRSVEEFEKYRLMARERFAAAGFLQPYYKSDRIPGFLTSWGREREALQTLNERLAFLTDVSADRLHEFTDAELDKLELMPIIDLLAVRGRAYAGLDSTERALRDYQTVFRLLEHLRSDVRSSASRGHLSKNLRPFYDQAIQLYYQQYRTTGDAENLRTAFRLSEQSRAYSLITAMHTNRGDVSAEERQLTSRVADLERRVSLGEEQQQTELERSRLRLDLIRSRRGDRTDPVGTLSLDSLADDLAANDCNLIEYHLSSLGSLVFVLSPQGALKAYPIEAADSLAARVERFRESILGGYYRSKSLRPEQEQRALDSQFLATGTALLNQILPPPLRETLHQRSRLCIVPDGVLNFLPFAALPLSAGELPLDYTEVGYLQDSSQLQYAYSGRYLIESDGAAERIYERNLLAFAPSFSDDGEAAERRGTNQLLRGSNVLGQLPFNRPEVEEILGLLTKATAYFGEEADRQHFLDALGNSRILHLSSHGRVHPTDPNLSFVAFTQTGDSIDREEMLYFNDLYGLPINNELTVLSACETALGELALGETVMSLASAFAAAGSRSTLTTLWEVDDRATKDLMVAFYRQLVDGASRSDALYAAQSDLRGGREYAHPYFWSAMTLYGASGPVSLEGDDEVIMPNWSYALTAALVISVIAYFLIILKRATITKIG